MPNIYIEARPKGRPEGSAVEDFVVEDRADHVLAAFKSQREAIEWARKNNHSPLVALVRHLNEKKSPTTGAPPSRQGTGFLSVRFLCCGVERIFPWCLSHPIPSRRSLTRGTPPSPRDFAMFRTGALAYAARKPGPVLAMRARTARN